MGAMPTAADLTVQQAGGRLELPAAGVTLRGSRLEDVDLSGQRVAVLSCAGSEFDRCDLSGLRAGGGSMSTGPVRTTWRGCTFRRSDLRKVRPGTARFESCIFEEARLEGWLCLSADFVACTFAGLLRDVTFSGHPVPSVLDNRPAPQWNEFRDNDFSAAELELVAFVRGVDLSAQTLPEGPQYVRVPEAPATVATAIAAVEEWPEAAERDAALQMLRSFSSRGYEEQQEIFTRRDQPTRVPESVRARVWALLVG